MYMYIHVYIYMIYMYHVYDVEHDSVSMCIFPVYRPCPTDGSCPGRATQAFVQGLLDHTAAVAPEVGGHDDVAWPRVDRSSHAHHVRTSRVALRKEKKFYMQGWGFCSEVLHSMFEHIVPATGGFVQFVRC